jgi:hypothetical protein
MFQKTAGRKGEPATFSKRLATGLLAKIRKFGRNP